MGVLLVSSKRKPNAWVLLWCSVSMLVLFCALDIWGFTDTLADQHLNPLIFHQNSSSRPTTCENLHPFIEPEPEPACIRTNSSDECLLPWRDLVLEDAFTVRNCLQDALIFPDHQISKKGVKRLLISFLDAMDRLLAYAIDDPHYGHSNSWFVYICEATIPSFDFTMQQSFVESFLPRQIYLMWDTQPKFHSSSLRQEELSMVLELRCSVLILDDRTLHKEIEDSCREWVRPR